MPRKPKNPDIEQMVKDGMLMYGDDDRLILRRLATGIPPLDALLGGGIPLKRFTMLVGPESTGKTLIAQYIAAAQQRTGERTKILYMDLELSYDREWWEASGIDVSDVLVSQPHDGEQAIDVMKAVLSSPDNDIGGVIIDSIATMYPRPMVEEPAEQKFIGTHPVLINRMFAILKPYIHDVWVIATNHLRANIGGHEEVYPGGKALKHNIHLTLRTRREGWLKEGDVRVGFLMEVFCVKNKTGAPQGSIQLPFRFQGQIDLVQSFLDEAITRKVIQDRRPYYHWEGEKFMGMPNMRKYFMENPSALEVLKSQLPS